VVNEGKLVGIVTAQDFLEISGRLFEEGLKSQEAIEGSASQARA